MDSAKVQSPLMQQYNNAVCEVCNIDCKSRHGLNFHYGEPQHKIKASDLTKCLFGYLPQTHITCLYDMYNDPERKVSPCIGLFYFREAPRVSGKPYFTCHLCDVSFPTIFHHVLATRHKKNYIKKHFSCLFENVESLPLNTIEKIAVVIESVERLQKFKIAINTPIKHSAFSEYPCREIVDKIVEQLQIHSIDFKNPYQEGYTAPCLGTGSDSSGTNKKNTINPSVASEPSAASENVSRQVNEKSIEKPQIRVIGFKDTYRKENTVSCLETASHASGINEKNGKRPLRLTSLAAFRQSKSELPSQNEGKPIVSLSRPAPVPLSVSQTSDGVFLGDKMNENTVSCLETASHASGINERNGKRALRLTPLSAFKRSKSELPSQNEGKPVVSMSSPAPVPFSVSPTSEGVNYDMTPKPIPTLCRSYNIAWQHFPSCQLTESYYQNAEHGQANSFSNVEGHTWGQEEEPADAKGGLLSSPIHPSGHCSSKASLNQDIPSHYGYSSVDSTKLSSKSYLPSGTMSVLNKELSLPESHVVIYPDGLRPITSTSSYAQTSLSIHSIIPAQTASVLTPDTLKILQGRDPTSVKSILKRLSEYRPELQQVNISLLVDVLFETGALSWVPV